MIDRGEYTACSVGGKMLRSALVLSALVFSGFAHSATIVENGVAKAQIVVPDNANAVERTAAEELRMFIKRVSGAEMRIVSASKGANGFTRILVGRSSGLDQIPRGAGKVVVDGKVVKIAGGDGDGDPRKSLGVAAGTLNAVYEFVDRELGVRFLWPDSKLGIVCPERKTISADKSYEWHPPFESVRIRRFPTMWARRAARAFTTRPVYPEGGSGGHAFVRWREKYASSHPEFFAMDAKGERQLFSGAMCVANPALHSEIVRLWREARAKSPNVVFDINACENDTKGNCRCPLCESWDDPKADPKDASERYARFYKAVYDLAAKEDPSVRVHGYAYSNYRNPPRLVSLPENVVISFVPSPKFPYDTKSRNNVLGLIDGWAKAGATLNYRPNLLDGYAMPEDISSDYYDEFQAMRRARMKCIDVDGPNMSFATQGPYLYILARMMVHPDWPLERLKDEYYSAFGPAKDAVRAYWEFWNRYALDNAEMFHEVPRKYNPIRHGMFFGFHYAFYAHHLFPRAKLEEAKMFIQSAAAAAGSGEYLERVRFLEAGLDHAILCSDCCAAFADKKSTKDCKLKLLKAVRDFRATRLPAFASDVKMFTNPGFCEMLAWPYAQYGDTDVKELPRILRYDGKANRPSGIPVKRGAVVFRDGIIVFPGGKNQHGSLSLEKLALPGGRKLTVTLTYRCINDGIHKLVINEREFPRIPPHRSEVIRLKKSSKWTTLKHEMKVSSETTLLHLYFQGRMKADQAVEYKEMLFELD